MTISKEYKWEMAHKLSSSYTKKCRHIHGHSYRAIFEFSAEKCDAENVVIDFTKISEELKPIIEMLDHNFLIHEQDEFCVQLVENARAGGWPIVVCDENPTAESIAKWLFFQAENMFHLYISRVTVFETATSSASFSAEDAKALASSGCKNLSPTYMIGI